MVPTGVERRWARNGIQTQPTKHGENQAMNKFFSYDMCSAKHWGGGECPREDATGKGASGIGRRGEERQCTKNGSPDGKLLQT